MPDIRDIVGQTSALEKIPSIDQRNQEIRAQKLAIDQTAQNAAKSETVEETKETQDKVIRKEPESDKRKKQAADHFEKSESEEEKRLETKEEGEKEPIELKGSDIIEVDEGKIIDVKI